MEHWNHSPSLEAHGSSASCIWRNTRDSKGHRLCYLLFTLHLLDTLVWPLIVTLLGRNIPVVPLAEPECDRDIPSGLQPPICRIQIQIAIWWRILCFVIILNPIPFDLSPTIATLPQTHIVKQLSLTHQTTNVWVYPTRYHHFVP